MTILPSESRSTTPGRCKAPRTSLKLGEYLTQLQPSNVNLVSRKYLCTSKLPFSACIAENPDSLTDPESPGFSTRNVRGMTSDEPVEIVLNRHSERGPGADIENRTLIVEPWVDRPRNIDSDRSERRLPPHPDSI